MSPKSCKVRALKFPQQSRPDPPAQPWTVGRRAKSGLLLHHQKTAWLLVPRHLCPRDSPPPWCEGSEWECPGCMGSPVLTSHSEGGGGRQVRSKLHPRSLSTLLLQAAQQRFTGRTVGVCASVRTEPAVTTSAASAPAAQASPGDTASRVSCPSPRGQASASYGGSLPLQESTHSALLPRLLEPLPRERVKVPPAVVFEVYTVEAAQRPEGEEGGRPCLILL